MYVYVTKEMLEEVGLSLEEYFASLRVQVRAGEFLLLEKVRDAVGAVVYEELELKACGSGYSARGLELLSQSGFIVVMKNACGVLPIDSPKPFV